MLENDPYVSELIDSRTSIRFHCLSTSGFYGLDNLPRCGGTKTFGPKEFITHFGDRRFSEFTDLRCPRCRARLHYIGLVDPKDFMEPEEENFYKERIITDYLIKFAILALVTLMLFGLSSYLPTQLAFILTSSILISATLIVIFLTLFAFFSRFRLAVIAFERNVKGIAISILLICLVAAIAALSLLHLL